MRRIAMNAKPIDLACQEVVELVSEYLGHRLTPEDRTAFDAHLETCPPCTTYLAQMNTVLTLAGSLDKSPPVEDVEHQLMAVFQRWHDKSAG
jgi:anti-sigma factor RsiW